MVNIIFFILNPIHFSEPKEREGGKKILEELGLNNQINLLAVTRLQEITYT